MILHILINRLKIRKMSDTKTRYEELVNKYQNEEEVKKKDAIVIQTNALRKKKNAIRAKYDAAVDKQEDALIAYERAVVDPSNISFDEQYLNLESAKATVKMYKDLYNSLFGEIA